MRSFINYLVKEGESIRTKEELNPKFEISAILRQLGEKESPAFLIEGVKGYDILVAGNPSMKLKESSPRLRDR